MFKVHGVLPTSNWGGLELELSDCGDAVRIRDNYSQPEEKLTHSEWIEIEMDEEDHYFIYNEEKYYLYQFMTRGL
jgi:hypothetical protein